MIGRSISHGGQHGLAKELKRKRPRDKQQLCVELPSFLLAGFTEMLSHLVMEKSANSLTQV